MIAFFCQLQDAEDVESVAQKVVCEVLLADAETAEVEYVRGRVAGFVAGMDPPSKRHWRELFAAVEGR